MSFNFNNQKDSSFFKNDESLNKVISNLAKRKIEEFTLSEFNYFLGDWIEDNDSQITFEKLNNKIIVGKIINSDFKYWFPDQIKLVLYKKNSQVLTYYQNRDHYTRNDSIKALVDEIVIGRFVRMFKRSNYFNEIKDFAYSNYPDSVGYLRIPNCDKQNLNVLDSILKNNHSAILGKKKMIIDLRNNLGGVRSVTNLLLPYVTEGKYQTNASRKRNSPLIRKQFEDFIKITNDSAKIKDYSRRLDDTSSSYISSHKENQISIDTFYKSNFTTYILINRKSISMAEIFVLSLLPNERLKIVGEESAGATVFGDIYRKVLKCGFWSVLCPTFETHGLINKYGVRNYSVKPDIYLNLPSKDQINYIRSL